MGKSYDLQIDLSRDSAHTRAIRLVGGGKLVLELGCATGYVSRILTERGCRVVGVEGHPEAAADARRICDEVIVADLDALDCRAALGDRRFDVILCGDVLEHLKDPRRLLAELRPFLRSDGRVVASLPNVAHASVIAELLSGRFAYRPWGLLDDSHLRFFTRDSIYECFEGAGFVIDHLERFIVEPADTEFQTDLSALPDAVARALLAGEESRTYQFILTARAADAAK
ncbi:MAG TPA: class I SAM-dependent methyltransferase [Vicinamibacteria bacterium]|jgi:2-polyprenyl-3-methyl-5-hydroxy-6-metoxy-1,4-benzoquinol methylase